MISLIAALEKETQTVIDRIENKKQFYIGDKKCFTGKLFGKDVSLILTGIGKVSSALSTQMSIDKFNPEYVVNFGSAGGVNNKIKLGSFYYIDKCAQMDFDITEIDDVPIGYIQEYDRVFFECAKNVKTSLLHANLASADKFSSEEDYLSLLEKNGCLVRDMEGAAIAQVCCSNNLPFISIKGISDVHGTDNDGKQFLENVEAVCSKMPERLKELFEVL